MNPSRFPSMQHEHVNNNQQYQILIIQRKTDKIKCTMSICGL